MLTHQTIVNKGNKITPPAKDHFVPGISKDRIASIDILRAITMVLMIFVNDLWSLTNIPLWLEHVAPGVDGIGLADIVFPAFLFIVGLSLPFSVDARIQKGDSTMQLLKHALVRSIALLIMGVFLVNGETIHEASTGLPRFAWNTICCLCFILIWNQYPERTNKKLVLALRSIAVATLVYLAFIYRGGADGALELFGPQWWGILGLIGWAYLVSSVLTIFARNNIGVILTAWLVFSSLSVLNHAKLLPEVISIIPSPISGGTLTALTLGGVSAALIFQHFRRKKDDRMLFIVFAISIAALLILYLITRPYWGLSKLSETPAWLFLCSAFTMTGFVVVYWISDVKHKEHWFRIIKPAGTATLLCYLIPYFAYSAMAIFGVSLPDFLLNGGVGLLKSSLFALLCVLITGQLLKWGLRFRL